MIYSIKTDVFPKVLLSSSRTLFSLTCRSFRRSLASVSSCTNTHTHTISSYNRQHFTWCTNTIFIFTDDIWQFRGNEKYYYFTVRGQKQPAKIHTVPEKQGEVMKNEQTEVSQKNSLTAEAEKPTCLLLTITFERSKIKQHMFNLQSAQQLHHNQSHTLD